VFREGSHSSMKRKPGDRPCFTTRGGIYALRHT
jgi:hypothetical protein